MAKLWCLAVGAPCMLLLTSCVDFEDWADSDRYKDDFHYAYAFAPGGSLSVDNQNGSIEITSWEQDSIEINGTKYASSKALLDDLKVDINHDSGHVRIRTLRPDWTHGNSGVRYAIRVPRRIQIDDVGSTNGSIRLEMTEGNARLHTTNGGIRVLEVKGEVTARTTNGRIQANRIEGNVAAHSTNGSIDCDSTNGSLDAGTTNGSIEARVADPSTNWPMKLETTNGHIDLTLRGSRLPDVRATTRNSAITLHLPESANAKVRAETSHHSSVTSDFEVLTHGGSRTRSELEGNIGSGGPLIELETRNGSIKILKM
ncbi:MAG TPA: DUF4097 family beta strand repeat-containing protein [Bryobacteraceae bacterium]|nr:DUF4097 family beta strand repeat-containing protein [Bryobacteraceae bacterium]